jgi:hypothetical protein
MPSLFPSAASAMIRWQSIPCRNALDSAWVLVVVLTAYALIGLSLLHGLWPAFATYQDIPRRRAVGMLAAACIALALCIRLAPHTVERAAVMASFGLRARGRLVWVSIVLTALVLPILVAFFILDRFPNSGDEYAYLFQAEQFARGHLWARPPPLGDTFVAFRTWVIGDKWLSQYPPGWPLMLALAMVAGIPDWSVNAWLGAAGVAALAAPCWGFRDRALAAAVFALYVLSPFYMLNSASFYSHTWAALLVLLVCITCLWYQREARVIALVACGALLGLLGFSRYFSLVLLLPALVWWLFVENKRHRLHIFSVMASCGAPILAALLVYQYWVTGDPLRSTYSLITTNEVDLSLKLENLMNGAWLSTYRFAELSLWTCPLLLPTYVLCLVSKLRSRSLAFYDLVFPSFVLGYVFFADLGGNRYGPRYYFDAFPLMLVTIVSSIGGAAAKERSASVRRVVVGALLVSGVYVVCALPLACNAFRHQVNQREEPYRLAAGLGLDDAIVIIQASSGPGILAEDLARNDTGLQGRVLYARPGSSVAELHRWSPARSVWIYGGHGRLERAALPQSDSSEAKR